MNSFHFLVEQTNTNMPHPDSMDTDPTENSFIHSFNTLAERVHSTACDKGWWEERDLIESVCRCHSPELGDAAERAIDGQLRDLISSELAEVCEADRHGDPADDKIPQFTGREAEIGDVIIRCMDYAAKRKLRVAEAIVAKLAMNKTRAYKHGKLF